MTITSLEFRRPEPDPVRLQALIEASSCDARAATDGTRRNGGALFIFTETDDQFREGGVLQNVPPTAIRWPRVRCADLCQNDH